MLQVGYYMSNLQRKKNQNTAKINVVSSVTKQKLNEQN